jgi:hypothetical protein
MVNAALGSTRKIEVVGHRSHEEILYSQFETKLQQRCEGWGCGAAVDKIHDLQPLRFALPPFRPWLLDDAILCMEIRSFDAVARLRSLEMHGRVADVVSCSETGPRQELSQSTGGQPRRSAIGLKTARCRTDEKQSGCWALRARFVMERAVISARAQISMPCCMR